MLTATAWYSTPRTAPRDDPVPVAPEVSRTDEPPSFFPARSCERIERLERRIKELEKEKGKRTAQQP